MMKHVGALGLAAVFLLAGCSSPGTRFWEAKDSMAAKDGGTSTALALNSDDQLLQTIEFRSGVSSASVERLAQRFGCVGQKGAGLITEKGPVEVYRMRCDNGTTFLARCELRQCRPMR